MREHIAGPRVFPYLRLLSRRSSREHLSVLVWSGRIDLLFDALRNPIKECYLEQNVKPWLHQGSWPLSGPRARLQSCRKIRLPTMMALLWFPQMVT